MKDDEKLFLRTVAETRPRPTKDSPFMDAIGETLGIHHKRVDYLLRKWLDRGWLECGVSVRSGWLTDAGLKKASEL